MSKIKTKTVIKKVPLYPCRLGIVISESEQEINKYFEEQGSGEVNLRGVEAMTVTQGSCKTDNDEYRFCVYVIFNPKELFTHGVIGHEIAHAVNAIFERIGQRLDGDNDEAQAYLAGWVCDTVYSAIKSAGVYGQIQFIDL